MSADVKSGLMLSLLFAVASWAVLVFRLCRVLRDRHPTKYETMGRPGVFWTHSPHTSWLLLRFLICREYNLLGDPALQVLCRVTLVVLVTYLSGFMALVTFA
jgi:hypothetical protein